MSLLNDALRAAEQRQQRPDAPGAYTGGAVQGGQGGSRRLVVVFLLMFLIVGIAAAYWLMDRDVDLATQDSAKPLEKSGQGKVQRPQMTEADRQPPSEPEANTPIERSPVAETPLERESPAKSSKVSAPDVADQTRKPGPEMVETEAVVSAEPAPQPQATEPSSETVEPEAAEAPVVKTTPQSPEAKDRQTAQNLEGLLSDGQMEEAERRLASLTQSQAAPRSRFVVARALLIEGDPDSALSWLPASAVGSDAPLRMLRARALHADGQLQAAVKTLLSRVPAVADQPEYRVTLATLLQQQGNSEEAARHWAELIAWDDSKAPWWVGLAISLEDQGQFRSAARAYEQAAALPGLSPSLADYVQRRLRSLRAG